MSSVSHVRSVLERDVPAVLRGKSSDSKAHVWGGRRVTFGYPESRTWLEVAVEHGWTAPRWPRVYGGGGLSSEQAKGLEAEIRTARSPAAPRRLRAHDDRADAFAVRQRGAETRAPAEDHARADPLVPGVLRAERRARTSLRCRRRLRSTAITTWSTVRRSGRATAISRTGCSCSSGRIPARARSRPASPSCSSIWRVPG